MLNYIWLGLMVLAIALGGFTNSLETVIAGGFDAAKKAVVDVALPLSAIIMLWLGVMRLAEKAGLVQALARALRPALRRLFPDIPPDDPAMGAIVMTVAANMLGVANASTPLGIRALGLMQRFNPYKGTATNAMCTFLTLNTASIQLIPATAVGILAVAGGKNPTAIVGTAFLATCCALTAGLVAVKTFEKLPMFRVQPESQEEAEAAKATAAESAPTLESAPQPAPLTRNGRIVLSIFYLAFGYIFVSAVFPVVDVAVRCGINSGLTLLHVDAQLALSPFLPKTVEAGLFGRVIKAVSVLAIPFFLSFFPIYAALRGVKVYEQFVEGAKEGFGTAVRIMPFLVAILSAVGMFRAAHGLDILATVLGPLLKLLQFPVELLPLTFMRPLSGSGSIALVAEVVKTHGPDHILSMMAGTILGCTETTFYVIAVYFGGVGIRRVRHSIAAGLIADAVGIIASIVICRLMFG